MLTARFGGLWRPLRTAFSRWSLLLTACAKLHNMLVDCNIPFMPLCEEDLARCDSYSVTLHSDVSGAYWTGRRRWEESCQRRVELTAQHESAGLARPCNNKRSRHV